MLNNINQQQQNICHRCGQSQQQVIATKRCQHQFCKNCIELFYTHIKQLIHEDQNKGNSEEFFECLSYKKTLCPTKIKLQRYDEMFKQMLPYYRTIIITQGEQHHNTNQQFLQQQNQQKQVVNNQINQNIPNKPNNGYQNLMNFDAHDIDNDKDKDKPNPIMQSQMVKPSHQEQSDSNNIFKSQALQMQSMIKDFKPEVENQQKFKVQNQNFVQQEFDKQNSNPLKLLQQSLKQTLSNQLSHKSSCKSPSNSEQKIPWQVEAFGKHLEIYVKAQDFVQRNKQDSLSTLYIDPYPQQDGVGLIDTTEDFANTECTITDEKLKVAVDYSKKMPLRRKIRGDGNCFYRSVLVQFLEKILVTNTANRALKFLEQILDEKFQIIDVVTENSNPHLKKKIPDLVRIIFIKQLLKFIELRCEILEKNQPINILISELEAIMMNNAQFDFSLVVVGRSLGMLAVNKYGQHPEYIAFCNDIDNLQQLLLIYGQDVELVIIPIITEVLDITLSIHSFDQVKGKWVLDPTTYSPKVNIENLFEDNVGREDQNIMHFQIDVLLHSGHYQLIYSQLYSKLVYGTIKNQVKPFNRIEWQQEQENKLIMQSKYQIQIKTTTCLVCNNKTLCACTRQCQHFYCDQCLQNMITFMEQRQYTYYNCHYKGIIKDCDKKLLMVEFYEMLSQFSNYNVNKKQLMQQKIENECTRCENQIKNGQYKKLKCGHKYCLECINYILDKICYSKIADNYQCKYLDEMRRQCPYFLHSETILKLISSD